MANNKLLKSIRLDQSTIKMVEEIRLDQNRNFSNMVETMIIDYYMKKTKEKEA